VLSGPVSNFQHTIEIDKGSSAGVKVGMPVITGAGLVGRVEQVTNGRSVVRLITDPGLDVGVLLEHSRDVGVAHGDGDGRPLKLDRGIDPKTDIDRGEVAYTSGVDRSSFPPDIPVGTVTAVAMAGDQLQQNVELEPLADLDQLAFVRVMLWEPGS
jgi:rod shape-determining protein MreC